MARRCKYDTSIRTEDGIEYGCNHPNFDVIDWDGIDSCEECSHYVPRDEEEVWSDNWID